MNRENLVILKGKSTVIVKSDGTIFKPNTQYRCIEATESKQREFIVNGIIFDEASFNQLFEYLHDVILREFKTLELVGENNKPLSKKAFSERANIHQYGRGKNMMNVLYFFIQPKEFMYGFYPQYQGDSKAKCVENAYKMYLDLLTGNMEDFDYGDIQRGNSGIPIGYGDLRVRPEYNPTNEKLEIYY